MTISREELNSLQGRARQMAMVQNPDLWPHMVLPVIRIERMGEHGIDPQNCGLIFGGRGPKVWPGNLITGITGAPPLEYPDWDGLLDVWEVD